MYKCTVLVLEFGEFGSAFSAETFEATAFISLCCNCFEYFKQVLFLILFGLCCNIFANRLSDLPLLVFNSLLLLL